jgi:hypothetical protein
LPTAFGTRYTTRTVLLLLLVTDGLVEGLNDKGGGRGDDLDLSLSVLDGELASDLHSLPVLGNIVTNLLGGLSLARKK